MKSLFPKKRNPFAVAAKTRKAGQHIRRQKRSDIKIDLKQEVDEIANQQVFICDKCEDTHTTWSQKLERAIPCIFCPTPCQVCRANGNEAFCGSTPCSCDCHVEYPNDDSFITWYVPPLTKEHIARLRQALAKCRGILQCIVFDPDNKDGLYPDLEEIKLVLKESADGFKEE